MEEQMEILLRTERKAETVEVLRILDEMTQEEQKEMLAFMQGVRFSNELKKSRKSRQTA